MLAGKNVTIEGVGSFVSAKKVFDSVGGNFTEKRRGVFERNRRGRWITVLYRMLFRFFLTKTAKNKQKLPQRIGYP